MNKRILISGGAGFIGSNLCLKLLSAKNDIFCLDNLSTGSLLNIKKMDHYNNFTFIGGGKNNHSSGIYAYSVIAGGNTNLNRGAHAFMGGGQSNYIYGYNLFFH